ncbi:MAG TPA: hypothetical protein VMR52_06495 [Dehalococcoidia bacterium]|nr:hypothetical protein [Dehalococcoidia bacterium]
MNETNRYLIVFFAALWIVLMTVVIFVTWAAPDDAVARIGDIAEFFEDNNTTAGQLVVTLGALATAVLALLWIVIELAPEDEVRELRVEQAGATTIIPADALRLRLEEALLELPGVTSARSRVRPRDKGVAVSMELAVTQAANVGEVTQAAVRTIVDTMHDDLGLPVSGTPEIKVAFGGSRATDETPASPPPTYQRPEPEPASVVAPPLSDAGAEGHADSSPGPLVYDATPDDPHPADEQQQQQ